MRIDKSVFVHKMAFISGEVRIRRNSSVWPGAVIRGDFAPVSIGEYTNVQDNAVIHADPHSFLKVGNYVTIGHSSVLHGCEIQDRVIIGMNATIMEGAKVARNSIIAANALVRENAIIPENSLVAGVPGEIKHRNEVALLRCHHFRGGGKVAEVNSDIVLSDNYFFSNVFNNLRLFFEN